ncbi:hypothetical protein OFN26_24150, partial [Escherichia coli]|nr:hypothetical protein [Escherichia coli]
MPGSDNDINWLKFSTRYRSPCFERCLALQFLSFVFVSGKTHLQESLLFCLKLSGILRYFALYELASEKCASNFLLMTSN